jgi:hypothetical protein
MLVDGTALVIQMPQNHAGTVYIVNNVALNDLSKFNNVVFERILNEDRRTVCDLPRFEKLCISYSFYIT